MGASGRGSVGASGNGSGLGSSEGVVMMRCGITGVDEMELPG